MPWREFATLANATRRPQSTSLTQPKASSIVAPDGRRDGVGQSPPVSEDPLHGSAPARCGVSTTGRGRPVSWTAFADTCP